MNLLLDTHTFLWFTAGDSNLSQTARAAIEDENNNLYLSVASIWEIAIKVSIEKLELSEPFEVLIPICWQRMKLSCSIFPLTMLH